MIRSSKLALGFDFNNNLNHAASGVYLSEWFDTSASGLMVSWLKETITSSQPSGTISTIEYRVNDTKGNTSWSSSIAGLSGRYAQVRVQFAKNEFAVSNPEVSNVVLTPQIPNMSATTNLLGRSEEFHNAYWGKVNATITPNVAVAPDGTLTAAKLSDSTTNGEHYVIKGSFTTTGVTYTLSVYAKSGELSRICLGGALRAIFNLTTGASENISPGAVAGSENVGNGWWRCWVTFTATADSYVLFQTVNDSSSAGYAGTGGGIYIWGAQCEVKPFMSQYVKTVATTASSVSSKAVMIEEGTTNLVVRSEEFATTWINTNMTITSDAAIAPDGTLSADKLIPNTTSAAHYIHQSVYTPGDAGAVSCYMKAGEYDWGWLGFFAGGSRAWFNLKTGTVGTVNAGISASIVPVGNGWYRCSIKIASTSATDLYAIVGTTNTDGLSSAWSGDNVSGIYIWGMQAEKKPYPTSYLKTTSATVTRNADVLQFPSANVMKVTSGTVIARVNMLTFNSGFNYILDGGGSGPSGFFINITSNKRLSAGIGTGSALNQLTGLKTINENNWVTVGVRWTHNKLDLYVNGELDVTNTFASNFAPVFHASPYIGLHFGSSTRYFNGLFEDFNVFHDALSDAEMVLYTSTGYVIPLTEKHSYKLGFDDSTLTHGEGGYRITPAYTLTDIENTVSGYVAWTANSGTSGTVNVDVSTDNGTTWTPVNSSGAITALENASASGKVLLLKQKLTTTNVTSIPSISDMTYRVGQKWKNAASQYIKALFNKLTLVPSGVAKWQLENKKYATSFMNGARVADTLTVPASGIFKPNSATIIMRVYVDGDNLSLSSNSHGLFESRVSDSSGRVILYNSGNSRWRLNIYSDTGVTTTVEWVSALSKGWHTFGARLGSGKGSLWVDGVKRDEELASLPTTIGTNLNIGFVTNTRQWNDLIDEVHIFGEALTDSEMQAYTNLPMDSTIAINEKHTYRHKFNNDLNYGTCGVWVSKWLDAGVNAFGTPWIQLDKTEIILEGTSIAYKFRASDTKDTNAVWYDDITNVNVKGRYIQIKAFLMSDDATTTTPEITFLEPVAKYS